MEFCQSGNVGTLKEIFLVGVTNSFFFILYSINFGYCYYCYHHYVQKRVRIVCKDGSFIFCRFYRNTVSCILKSKHFQWD